MKRHWCISRAQPACATDPHGTCDAAWLRWRFEMLQTSFHAKAQKDFDPAPSLASANKTKIVAAKSIPAGTPCIGVPVASDGDIPKQLGIDRKALAAMGFEGKAGQTLLYPAQGTTFIAFGV